MLRTNSVLYQYKRKRAKVQVQKQSSAFHLKHAALGNEITMVK